MDKRHDSYTPFEKYIDAMEWNAAQTTLFAILQEAGIPLPNPDDVSDHDIFATLWTVIDGLWDHGVILYSTNHLNDRQLYTLLFADLLVQPGPIIPEEVSVTTHLDILGGWSAADLEVFLRYYADDEGRSECGKHYGKPIPEHVDPPYDRDRLLPGH